MRIRAIELPRGVALSACCAQGPTTFALVLCEVLRSSKTAPDRRKRHVRQGSECKTWGWLRLAEIG